jgi:hypothetical protein
MQSSLQNAKALQAQPCTAPRVAIPKFAGLKALQRALGSQSQRAAAPVQRASVIATAAATAEKPTVAAPPTEQAATPMNIVFISAEVAPWSKTGGLGDVVSVYATGGHDESALISGHCALFLANSCVVRPALNTPCLVRAGRRSAYRARVSWGSSARKLRRLLVWALGCGLAAQPLLPDLHSPRFHSLACCGVCRKRGHKVISIAPR